MSSTSAEVLRESQKTIAAQSKIIARQQKSIQKLTQKLVETGSGEDVLDEDSSWEDLLPPEDSHHIVSATSKDTAIDFMEVPFVQVETQGQKAKAMLLTPKTVERWNTVLDLSTKVKAFEKEIKRESDLIGDILFVKDMFE